MSKYQQSTWYSKKQLALQQVNTHVAIHDLNCGCNKPLQHIITTILEKEPSLKEDKEFVDTIKTCLTSEAPGGTPGDEEENFGPGDLEKLFEEDFGEQDTGDTR